MSILAFGFNEADVAAAFDASDFYFGDIIKLGIEAQIFVEVVFGNMIDTHRFQNHFAVLDDYFGTAFDEAAEPMRVISNEREHSMHENDDDAAAECGKKCGAAVDRARQYRRENDNEDGIERGLARERAFMTKPDHDQRRQKDNDAAERDLHKGEIFWFEVQPEERGAKIVNRIHIQRFYRLKKVWRGYVDLPLS